MCARRLVRTLVLSMSKTCARLTVCTGDPSQPGNRSLFPPRRDHGHEGRRCWFCHPRVYHSSCASPAAMTGDRRVAPTPQTQPHTRHPDQLANEEVSGQHEPAGPMPPVDRVLYPDRPEVARGGYESCSVLFGMSPSTHTHSLGRSVRTVRRFLARIVRATHAFLASRLIRAAGIITMLPVLTPPI